MAKPVRKKKHPSRPTAPENRAVAEKPLTVKSRKWLMIFPVIAIIAAVLVIYWPVLYGDWLWDDDVDITGNEITQSPTGLWSIWFDPGSQLDYYPIKASVQWVQWHLWGNHNTLGYHLTNIILHMVNALLVWRLLSKLRLPLAWVGGLIFAVHPGLVDSVAWIAELKNTLSQVPTLLFLCYFVDYEDNGRRRDYLLALGFFLIAMLCKTSMMALPVWMLIYVWWKRGRITWHDLKIAAPFFLISFVLGLVTVYCPGWFAARWQQPNNPMVIGGLLSRIALSGLSFGFYFWEAVWPFGLAPIYTKWVISPPSWWQFLPWIAYGTLLWASWKWRATWGRHVILGVGFFALNLAPFLGFVGISYMRFTWVMDHFLYLPILGIIGLVVLALGLIQARLKSVEARTAYLTVIVMILGILTFASNGYAKAFVGQEALWVYTIQANPNAWLAYNNLGNIYSYRNDYANARILYDKALSLFPDYAEAHNNIGNALQHVGEPDLAEKNYRAALVLNPNYSAAHNNLAHLLKDKGQLQEAIEEYNTAIRIQPNYSDAISNLAAILLEQGHINEAIELFQKAINMNPDNSTVPHYNLGNAYLQAGRWLEAMDQYRETIRMNPQYADAHNNLGYTMAQVNMTSDAIAEYHEAIRINPNNVSYRCNLAISLAANGQIQEAINELQIAQQLSPNNKEIPANIKKLQQFQKEHAAKKK